MRKRKYLIGGLLGAIGALVLATSASAAVTGQTYTSIAQGTKQDKKQFGGFGFTTIVDTTYNVPPPTNATPSANRTVLTFTKDWKLGNSGNLANCNLAALAGKTTDQAKAACPGSQVGQGDATEITLSGLTLQGTVTAFNGSPTGGSKTIYLHTDFGPAVPTKPILTGALSGNTLDVNVPVVQGTALTHFSTTINKVKTGKNMYYVMAKCSKKNWTNSETTTFVDGSTKTSTTTQKCKQKKSKKKK
jgi:hypothetical protein